METQKCSKCSGLMISQRFYTWGDFFDGYLCANCGVIEDPIILQNRAFHAPDRTRRIKAVLPKGEQICKLSF